jgi:general secretion pathway protein G
MKPGKVGCGSGFVRGLTICLNIRVLLQKAGSICRFWVRGNTPGLQERKGYIVKANSGFTLVEILVVVVVLGVLGAIVIPQFSPAATQAKTSRIRSDLQVTRVAIQMYKVQHNDELPGTTPGVALEQALTEKTELDGTLNAGGPYGPYLQMIPTNPFNELDTIEVDGVLGGGTHGWHFNTTTGDFHADTDGQASL